MALSGNRIAALAAAAFTLLACAGCGVAAGEVAEQPAHVTELTPPLSPPQRVDLRGANAATVAEPLSAEMTAGSLPMFDRGDVLQPAAVYGERVLVSRMAAPASPGGRPRQSFEIWDPATGQFSPAWVGTANAQEIVRGVEGDWAVVVKTSFAMPFADWSLELRNLQTGEVVVVDDGDPKVATAPGVQPQLPLGFAPMATVANGALTWDRYVVGDGKVAKEIVTRDMRSGATRVVAASSDATAVDLRMPVSNGKAFAWLINDLGSETTRVGVLRSGDSQVYVIDTGGSPWATGIAADGNSVLWDDPAAGKFELHLDSGNVTAFADGEGWGIDGNGSHFSWAPAGSSGGRAGFYDAATDTTRLVATETGHITNLSAVMGPWFVWQDLVAGENPSTANARSAYRFLKIG